MGSTGVPAGGGPPGRPDATMQTSADLRGALRAPPARRPVLPIRL